jgi:hypothetical protein
MILNRFRSSVNGLGSLIDPFPVDLDPLPDDPVDPSGFRIASHKVRMASVGLDLAAKKAENFSNLKS